LIPCLDDARVNWTGAGADLRMPSPLELKLCRYQGEHVAKITRRYALGPLA